ncbi:MAG: endoglucanase [Hamadaea sp.]|uniref:glycoside hydrolase family 6 protein n=1 Tax=Hamadaea sp. TaxID=2024425 RepID=UPI0017A1CC26|nr:glycoside hydrolase family 6 protein [Hamadaea sp.]NUR71061.1 endoglucanase [Hamadaea sp.]NUT23994.1 endoglucanase [Hamadaea sp.]
MRQLSRLLGAAALALPLALFAAPAAYAGPELITNGTFSSSTSPWWSTGNLPLSVDGGRLKAAVPGGTANRWDAMFGEKSPALTLHQNHSYTLSFDASATATRTVRTTVQLNADPYPATIDQLFTVDATSRHFSWTFTGTLETTNGEITFQLGGLAGGAYNFWIDNVSLVDATTGSGSPLDLTSGFYVDPDSNPAVWVRNNGGDSRAAQINAAIATKPMARWFGAWSGDIGTAVGSFVGAADAADKLPVLVAYNIPGRDACGGHSGGGAGSPDAYQTWIAAFASAIGSRPAVVIIEPDSLADFGCMDSGAIKTRNDMILYATQQFHDKAPNTWAYLDAGNPGWVAAGTMADRLTAAGLTNVRGFSINVSNYFATSDDVAYGAAVNTELGADAKPFVVDTSRNGKGTNGEWCNPAERQLGSPAQVGGGAEMLLWVKVPGDSDGDCGIGAGIPAGQFSPDLAMHLITGS